MVIEIIDTCYYLPHRPVIKEDIVTTKIRIVYDASLKTQGPSLTKPLLAMLLRFRCNSVAFFADIEKACLVRKVIVVVPTRVLLIHLGVVMLL